MPLATLTRRMKRLIADFASGEVSGNDAMHAMPHLRQTARIALMLARREGADPDVCWAAAMLHDIRKAHPGDHGAAGAESAARFLQSIGLPSGFIRKVRDAIFHHNKGFGRGPIERQILWDADKLPLLSPRGFNGRMVPFWRTKLGRKEGTRKSAKEYQFFYERTHTDSARRIAEKNRAKMLRLLGRPAS